MGSLLHKKSLVLQEHQSCNGAAPFSLWGERPWLKLAFIHVTVGPLNRPPDATRALALLSKVLLVLSSHSTGISPSPSPLCSRIRDLLIMSLGQ